MTLLEKRDAIIRHRQVLESIPETAWSARNPVMQAKLADGEMMLSDRLIAFQDDDRVFVVGECADRIIAALSAFTENHLGKTPYEKMEVHAMKVARSIRKRDVSERFHEGEALEFTTRDWNACLFALEQVKIQVCTTDTTGL